MRPRYGHFA
ncbi:hypothetical protein YPPY92_3506, partial [Yersinia pestis PY-92]